MKKANPESHAETRSSRRESSWQTKPLEEVCHVEYGTRVVQKRDGGKGFPVYGGGGATFEMDGFNREDRLVIARFGMSGECTRFVAGKFYLNDSGLTVSPKNGAMHQRFLDYQMLALNDDIYALGKGTAQKNLDVPVFRTLPLFVPESLAEQQRIVGLLDEAFEGLATAKANAEKNLQNARALFESHLQSVFTQSGPGWVETTLSRATDGIFTGPFGSLLHKSDYIADGIPLVNPAHITEVGIEPDLNKTVSKATALRLKNYIMREGDIVIGRRGEMGRCALVTEVEDGWLCGTGSFFIKPSSRCDTRYLVRFLRSDSCKARLEKIAGGAVMPNLSNTDLGNLSFDLPPLDWQKSIVEEIDSLHEQTHRLALLYEQKLAALEALKKSLLHQAFTGEL